MAKSKFLASRQQFHFRWYMVVILIGIVAIVGMSVLYFSQASSFSYYGQETMTGGEPIFGIGAQSNTIVSRSLATSLPVSFSQDLPTNSTQTLCVQLTGIPAGGTKLYVMTDVSSSKGGTGGSGDLFVETNGWVQIYQDDWSLHFAQDGPTAKITAAITGSKGTNKPSPNPTVQITQFAIVSGGLSCPTN